MPSAPTSAAHELFFPLPTLPAQLPSLSLPDQSQQGKALALQRPHSRHAHRDEQSRGPGHIPHELSLPRHCFCGEKSTTRRGKGQGANGALTARAQGCSGAGVKQRFRVFSLHQLRDPPPRCLLLKKKKILECRGMV